MAGESMGSQQGVERINGVRHDLYDSFCLILFVTLPQENSYGTEHHAEGKF